jgi:hypothetical protein
LSKEFIEEMVDQRLSAFLTNCFLEPFNQRKPQRDRLFPYAISANAERGELFAVSRKLINSFDVTIENFLGELVTRR